MAELRIGTNGATMNIIAEYYDTCHIVNRKKFFCSRRTQPTNIPQCLLEQPTARQPTHKSNPKFCSHFRQVKRKELSTLIMLSILFLSIRNAFFFVSQILSSKQVQVFHIIQMKVLPGCLLINQCSQYPITPLITQKKF